jgi:hypothetical protein
MNFEVLIVIETLHNMLLHMTEVDILWYTSDVSEKSLLAIHNLIILIIKYV